MSQSFNFPANPTLNQLVQLPDGSYAQWNGYAWVSVVNNVTYPLGVPYGGTGATNPLTAKRNLAIPIWTLDDTAPAAPVFGDRWIRPGSMTEVVWLPNANNAGVWVNLADAGSVAYPIPVSKGGTGATTAAQARTNLGLDGSIPWMLQDGTAAAPGLAFASETGLGWYRQGADIIATACGGVLTSYLNAPVGGTSFALSPRSANGSATFYLGNQPNASPNANVLAIVSGPSYYGLSEVLQGTATTKPLVLTFPGGINVNQTNILMDVGGLTTNNVQINKPTVSGEASLQFGNKANGQIFGRWLCAANTGDMAYQNFNDAGAYINQVMIARASGNLILSNGIVSSTGYLCRAGISGANGGNTFNLMYNGNSTTTLWIDATNFGTINTTSDERIKHMITPLVADLESFMKIRPIRYHFANVGLFRDDGTEYWGFSAQNLLQAGINAVMGDVNEVQEDGTPQPASVIDRAILAVTVLEVQALLGRVAQLEARP